MAPAAWSRDLDDPWIGWERQFTYVARISKRLHRRQFDVIHDHTGPTGVLLALLSDAAPTVVHTIHLPVPEPRHSFYREVDDRVRIVALSKSHASSLSGLRIAGVVHNAVDIEALAIGTAPDDYLLEINRIAPEKGQHLAIEVSRRSGRRLILAGKVGAYEEARRYFQEMIDPHLGSTVDYLGNVQGAQKATLIKQAAAGIFPIQWSEPFGLGMAECMASGTPAIALDRGASAEIIEQGVTGYVAGDIDELVSAVGRLDQIDREKCAIVARDRFSPRRMAQEYLEIYLG